MITKITKWLMMITMILDILFFATVNIISKQHQQNLLNGWKTQISNVKPMKGLITMKCNWNATVLTLSKLSTKKDPRISHLIWFKRIECIFQRLTYNHTPIFINGFGSSNFMAIISITKLIIKDVVCVCILHSIYRLRDKRHHFHHYNYAHVHFQGRLMRRLLLLLLHIQRIAPLNSMYFVAQLPD